MESVPGQEFSEMGKKDLPSPIRQAGECSRQRSPPRQRMVSQEQRIARVQVGEGFGTGAEPGGGKQGPEARTAGTWEKGPDEWIWEEKIKDTFWARRGRETRPESLTMKSRNGAEMGSEVPKRAVGAAT